jgi:flagellar M-ring protein FliF
VNRLLQISLLSLVALAIALGLLRPMLRSMPLAANTASLPRPDGQPPRATPALDGPAALSISSDQRALMPANATDGTALPDAMVQRGAGADVGVPALASARNPDPVERLRQLIEEREEETIEILRSWMNEDEELTR